MFDSHHIDEIKNCNRFLYDNTYFTFNNNVYKQIYDTPMGSPISPLFADIVMDDLEKTFLQTLKNNYNCVPLFYYRYVTLLKISTQISTWIIHVDIRVDIHMVWHGFHVDWSGYPRGWSTQISMMKNPYGLFKIHVDSGISTRFEKSTWLSINPHGSQKIHMERKKSTWIPKNPHGAQKMYMYF